jgi:glycosyltransferase involved in cell wall biosynthesis
MPKILFTGVHRPQRSPSQRYRIEQFLESLSANGYTYDYTYIISKADDTYFYKPGNYLKKAFFLLRSLVARWWETFSFHRYDYIFVQREAMITGAYFYEKKAARSKAKLIFDFDDAIWMQHVSEGNKKFSFLKDPNKTRKLIELADCVLAGNTYLQEYALQFNTNSILFPTIVDTQKYRRLNVSPKDYVCIGWSGSFSTFEHFLHLEPILLQIYEKYGDRIKIKVIGAPKIDMPFPVDFAEWKEETEVFELSEFDIGIMPLNESEWNKGKCGLKGLLYMSMGIPAVLSPVGVSNEIVSNGLDGFLARTENEWFKILSELIDNENLRTEIGEKGRKKAEEHYSLNCKKNELIRILSSIQKK